MSDSLLLNLIWDDSEGPLENIFGLIEMGVLFIPGFRIATLIGAAFGLGPKNFGKWLDSKLNLKDLDDLTRANPDLLAEQSFNDIERSVEQAIKQSGQLNRLEKQAFAAVALRKLWRLMSQSGKRTAFKRSWTSLFKDILNAAKNITLGGLSALTLSGIRGFDDDGKPYGEKIDFNKEKINSTKETANRIRNNLESAVDKAFTL